MKPDDLARGDHLLRRHSERAVGSQNDSPLPSAEGACPANDTGKQTASDVEIDMPATGPFCPLCQDALFVRLERVLSGRRVSTAYYCGRCRHEWQVEATPSAEIIDRRMMERRRRSRLD